MSDRKSRRKGRARYALAQSEFEQALMSGDEASRRPYDPREDRKTLQLCRQVQQALMLALDDDILNDVYVESVEPIGGASQLLVRIAVPPEAEARPAEVMSRLNERSVRLRAIVAQSISRKRAPSLSFVAVAAQEGGAS